MISKTKAYFTADYTPSAHDVLCAKGKSAFTHPGNRRFRLTVELCLHTYQHARTKTDKSIIVSGIIEKIGTSSHFIRYDRESDLYYDIGEEATREKIGQTLREALIQNDPEKKERKKHQRAITKAKRREKRLGNDVEIISQNLVVPDRRRRSLRVMKRESFCLLDKALAAMPPTLQFASSNTWFADGSDSEESLTESAISGEDLDALFAPSLMVGAAAPTAVAV
mmetsp:Transcript_11520/g.19166  ORF Transcript_11520/g.19166 Transcript_11520/m.19166 type:complete len:224 (-) Transcript_11520:114-785(-)|eukprot:CAMPEP_0119012660 /NCGR_PEP_ID=MMETSP1176-20130426/7183_1 /TAXON_ID=265551 /ORGANISM="Synedropsis recta cf, Strain CCMP1620" /LENGTH=223 /DNA_ID=CAMNT_0006965661 /DNA_START=50 /DNA_END=721 /DNA_ORIENTATION=+